jgi:hypothetical protein
VNVRLVSIQERQASVRCLPVAGVWNLFRKLVAPKEKQVINAQLEGMILKHEAKRRSSAA